MTPKFNKTDLVEVAGDATGYGDLQGVITDIELSDILGEPYYTVRVKSDEVQKVYVAERFISRIDMIGLIQELTMKAALDKPKLIDPSSSMQEALAMAYKQSIMNQCRPNVILRFLKSSTISKSRSSDFHTEEMKSDEIKERVNNVAKDISKVGLSAYEASVAFNNLALASNKMKTVHYNLGKDPKNGSFRDTTACNHIVATAKSKLEVTEDKKNVTCKVCLSYLDKRERVVESIKSKGVIIDCLLDKLHSSTPIDTDLEECTSCDNKFNFELMEHDSDCNPFCPECWEELAEVMEKEYKQSQLEE